jgi:hypothetical protein
MASDQSGLATIVVVATHSRLAFIYGMFKPTIAINAERHRRSWGTHSFEVSAGSYEIAVSYPWFLSPECGKNSVKVNLKPGEVKKVSYRAGLIRYLPGTIVVE